MKRGSSVCGREFQNKLHILLQNLFFLEGMNVSLGEGKDEYFAPA